MEQYDLEVRQGEETIAVVRSIEISSGSASVWFEGVLEGELSQGCRRRRCE
jgi:hypothetical protein